MKLRNFTAISALALLAACWQSEQPLIPAGEADSPPQIAGTYDIMSQASGQDGAATVTKGKGAGTFDFEATDADGLPVKRVLRFDQLSGEWYLLQAQTVDQQKGPGQPNYRIVRVGGGMIREYEPGCGSPEAAIPDVKVEEGDCTFTTYAGLKAAALGRLKLAQGGDSASLSLQKSYSRK